MQRKLTMRLAISFLVLATVGAERAKAQFSVQISSTGGGIFVDVNPEGVGDTALPNTGPVSATTVSIPTIDFEAIGSVSQASALVDATAAIANLRASAAHQTSGTGPGGGAVSATTSLLLRFSDEITLRSTTIPDGTLVDVRGRLRLMGDWIGSEGGTGSTDGSVACVLQASPGLNVGLTDQLAMAGEDREVSQVFQARIGIPFNVNGSLSFSASAAHFASGSALVEGDFASRVALEPLDATVTIESASGVPYGPLPRVPISPVVGAIALVAMLLLVTVAIRHTQVRVDESI